MTGDGHARAKKTKKASAPKKLSLSDRWMEIARQRGMTARESFLYSSFLILGKFPQMLGQPAVTLSAVPVVRVSGPPAALVKLMSELACTCVDPATAEVI